MAGASEPDGSRAGGVIVNKICIATLLRLRAQSERSYRVMRSFKAAPPDDSQQRRRSLPRTTRDARVRQLLKSIAEFCSLSFDHVDPSKQAALTQRMLAFLRSLDVGLTYWDDNALWEENGFNLLGLNWEAIQAIEDATATAWQHIESRNYRAAYESLCEVRPQLSATPGHIPDQVVAPQPEVRTDGPSDDEPEDPPHFADIVLADFLQLRLSCPGERPAIDLSDAPAEDIGYSYGAPFFQMQERTALLQSRDTRLTRRQTLHCGEFVVSLFPRRVSQKQGCSGFKATGGLCHVQIKMLSGTLGKVNLSIYVGHGDLRRSVKLEHDFSEDSLCMLPELIDLRRASDRQTGMFTLTFVFHCASGM